MKIYAQNNVLDWDYCRWLCLQNITDIGHSLLYIIQKK